MPPSWVFLLTTFYFPLVYSPFSFSFSHFSLLKVVKDKCDVKTNVQITEDITISRLRSLVCTCMHTLKSLSVHIKGKTVIKYLTHLLQANINNMMWVFTSALCYIYSLFFIIQLKPCQQFGLALSFENFCQPLLVLFTSINYLFNSLFYNNCQ